MSEELKPVAFMYERPDRGTRFSKYSSIDAREGWKATPLYSADQIAAMQEEITRLRHDLGAAVAEVSKWAAKAGEAQGRLEMSEASGIVDMWRAKCEALEADKAGMSFERCVERVFQAACNEFAQDFQKAGTQSSAMGNVFFLASSAIREAWPEIIEEYTRDDPKHGGGA